MNRELAFALSPEELPRYRERTLALLRRYFRSSIEVGRLPSILGRECFRAKVTSYRFATFEDAVIFVHDTERCLAELDRFSQRMIAAVVFQDYSLEDLPGLLHCGRATIFRRYPEALDGLSRIFLSREMLHPLTCQAPETEENSVTICNERK
jgi:hypothetical protein